MYPRGELTDLARRKAHLRDRIALERERCASAWAVAVRPIARADAALSAWRRLLGLVRVLAVPLGGAALRWLAPRLFRGAETPPASPSIVQQLLRRVLGF